MKNSSTNLVIKHGGQPATTSEIIASNTDNEHASVIKLVRDYQSQLEEFEGVRFEIVTFQTAGGKQKREVAILNEPQATFLLTLMRNSETVVRFKLALVKEFYDMRTQLKSPVTSKRYIDAATAFIRNAAIDLKMAQSSVLGMYQKLEDKVGFTGLLPYYAVDAPTSNVAGSSEVTLPASELLKQHGVEMGAPTFNKLLMKHGILEEHERPSTHGTKKFKVITDLEYGKNITSPTNPRETQPHWYVSKFNELLSLVLTEGVTA